MWLIFSLYIILLTFLFFKKNKKRQNLTWGQFDVGWKALECYSMWEIWERSMGMFLDFFGNFCECKLADFLKFWAELITRVDVSDSFWIAAWVNYISIEIVASLIQQTSNFVKLHQTNIKQATTPLLMKKNVKKVRASLSSQQSFFSPFLLSHQTVSVKIQNNSKLGEAECALVTEGISLDIITIHLNQGK